jgi:c-di-AMP phosphodiesterase-like protein
MEVKIEKEMRNEKEVIFIVYIDNKKSNYHNDKNLNENERKEIQKRISNMRKRRVLRTVFTLRKRIIKT